MAEATDQDTLVEVDIRWMGDLVAFRIECLGELRQWINCPWSRTARKAKITKSVDGRDNILDTEGFAVLEAISSHVSLFSPSESLSLLLVTLVSADLDC